MPASSLAGRIHTLSGFAAATIQNEDLAVTVLPGKGGEIYSIVVKSRGFDLLWKSPWGLHPPRCSTGQGAESEAAWMDSYGGGWQGIFPNGGDSCSYRGALLGFHGEASTIDWASEIEQTATGVKVRMQTRLARSPFLLERVVTLEGGEPAVRVDEWITNEGSGAIHAMWGQHPALATELLAGAAIEVSAASFQPHFPEISPSGRVDASRTYAWPLAGGKAGEVVDLSIFPGLDERMAQMGYLSGMSEGRYVVRNASLGLAVVLEWELATFPYLWYWAEWGGSPDWPWYGRCRVAALEPFSSIPGTGLTNAIGNGTAMVFEAGERKSTCLRFSVETSLA